MVPFESLTPELERSAVSRGLSDLLVADLSKLARVQVISPSTECSPGDRAPATDGEAPITNILEALAPAWPEIAKKARVTMVVVDLPYADSSVEKVDVTEMLLDWPQADERTRTIVRGLK